MAVNDLEVQFTDRDQTVAVVGVEAQATHNTCVPVRQISGHRERAPTRPCHAARVDADKPAHLRTGIRVPLVTRPLLPYTYEPSSSLW